MSVHVSIEEYVDLTEGYEMGSELGSLPSLTM